MPGSKALRPEIAKLQTNINLLSAAIDVPIKQFSITSIGDFTKGVRIGIKSLQMKLSSINTEVKKFIAQHK